MNDAHTITAKNLLAALPQVLQDDPSVFALATAAAEVLSARTGEIDNLRIYARIDELPEELLDILAYDFKVDWWDSRYSIEQKRQTLKDSFLVHKRLGTKYAVETALSAIYPNSTIQEWFEYDGEPYTFRLLVNVSGQVIDPELYFRAIDLTNYYKNLRSHLRGVEYIIEAKEAATLRMGGRFASNVKLYLPELPDEYLFSDAVHVGGQMASVTTLSIPKLMDRFSFEDSVRVGGQISAVTTMALPTLPDQVALKNDLHFGGKVASITSINLPPISDET